MTMGEGCCGSLFQCCIEYETPKTIVIRNKTVGLLYRLIQALIIGYVIGYVCIYKKAYQDTDSIISSVRTKVKGIATTNTAQGPRVWDAADYILPPQEENSFFVLTNMIITANQTQTHCPELPSPSTMCTSDTDCTPGFSDPHGNGVQTGKCVEFSVKVKTCEVLSWCPLEIDTNLPNPAVLKDAERFTVLIKNNILYPKFGFSKRNILPNITSSYLKTCTFSRLTDPHCPIFHLKDIVEEAGEDFQTMAVQGGVMGILIDWNCDLDRSEKNCIPKYSFKRLDNKNPDNNAVPGYNFRFAKYFKDDGVETRTLTKAYGIRFDVIVFGKAGKFSVVPLVVNIGGALAFLGKANVVCNWIILNFSSKRDYYKKHKTTVLDESEDMSELTEGTRYGTQ